MAIIPKIRNNNKLSLRDLIQKKCFSSIRRILVFTKYLLFVSLFDKDSEPFKPLKPTKDDDTQSEAKKNQSTGPVYGYIRSDNRDRNPFDEIDELQKQKEARDEFFKILSFKVLKEEDELNGKEKLDDLIICANELLRDKFKDSKNKISEELKKLFHDEVICKHRSLEREFKTIRFAGYYFGLCVFILDLDSSLLIESDSGKNIFNSDRQQERKENLENLKQKSLAELRASMEFQTTYIKCIIEPLLDLGPSEEEKAEKAKEQKQFSEEAILKDGFSKLRKDFEFHWAAIPIEAKPGGFGIGAAIHHIMPGKGIPNAIMLGAAGGGSLGGD